MKLSLDMGHKAVNHPTLPAPAEPVRDLADLERRAQLRVQGYSSNTARTFSSARATLATQPNQMLSS